MNHATSNNWVFQVMSYNMSGELSYQIAEFKTMFDAKKAEKHLIDAHGSKIRVLISVYHNGVDVTNMSKDWAMLNNLTSNIIKEYRNRL